MDRNDAEDSIARSFVDFHDINHEMPSIKMCFEEPCKSVNMDGLNLLDEWRRN